MLRKKITKPKTEPRIFGSGWMKLAVLAFLGYVVYSIDSGYRSESRTARLAAEKLEATLQRPAFQGFLQTIQIADKIRQQASIEKRTLKTAAGIPTLCGDHVRIAISITDADGNTLERHEPDAPLQFRIGDHSQMPGIELGTLGMKPGDIWQLAIPARLAYDAKGFHRDDVPSGTSVGMQIVMLGDDSILNETHLPVKIFEEDPGSGEALQCGDKADIKYQIYDITGTSIAASAEDTFVAVTLGSKAMPAALSHALLGLRPGGTRTVLLRTEKMEGGVLPLPQETAVIITLTYVRLLEEK
ncbi:MAG: FKBP-type peptidyl-prolyl cis-trans isomerase [Rickettsiales bacterium]|nr:FKBP-type peptidyl-prolyl cis-trans isomerase [Rickettsiales bacterium]